MSDATDHLSLQEAIRCAPGTAFIDRSFGRSFSLNIFRRNAEELIAATRDVRDPDQGLRLMALENRETGLQAHREINRLVHNFVAGSMSLIDHTRQFMREHYSGTVLEADFRERVKSNFSTEPVAKFVQDLRNYMVHKGLPNSQMFIHFDNTSNPDAGAELTTGVQYKTDSLLEWNSWTAPAKAYIRAAGEHLDLHAFAESYLDKVLQFHEWLDEALREFHAADIVQLKALQDAHALLSVDAPLRASSEPREVPGSSATSDQPPIAPPFEFPHVVAAVIDEVGKAILAKIRRLDFIRQPADHFPSERPIGATVTQDAMLETPIAWGNDSEGRPVIAFLISGPEVFGLDADAYADLQPLADKILQLGWAKQALSRKFIEEAALRWFRSSFRATQQASLSSALSSASPGLFNALY